jgi:DNA-binding transcriptional ArsR family regulator
VTDVPDELDGVLGALANRHRREIVRLLAQHPHSISRLAELRGLSLPAINKHVGVLEGAGLVGRRKLGRTTFLALGRAPLLALRDWIGEFNAHWGTDAESLENYEPYLTRATDTMREAP